MKPNANAGNRLIILVLVIVFLGLSGVGDGSRALAQGLTPEAAVARMRAADGLTVSLVAAESLVRQPVAIEFDDRGRLWVIQYLQYPNPEGLKRVQVDRYSRTVYDRIPDPPPKGPRGADRLTILQAPDGSGRFREAKDFITGLNLASGLAFGVDGVYVLQTPYLLFYPDRDRDDVPDSDPNVLVAGFGMEDAHSVANSLTWGPDGWLYGCQGSTVTARIRNPARPGEPPIEFQQGVWRYHPPTRRFELFCEGGGNSWGLDFDRRGHLLYSTNFGPYVMMHGDQGGYGWKSFGKHGPLHNPHAYGFFDHVPHQGARGGHVTAGGLFYRGGAWPREFQDQYIGADVLGHNIYAHAVEPQGSTFRSRFAREVLVSNDPWFAPCDLTAGPDGAIYVADWHDQRTAHPDPDADWDRSNGRIYRIAAANSPKDAQAQAQARGLDFDLRRWDSAELAKRLSDPNHWIVRRARRILAERRDPAIRGALMRNVQTSTDETLVLESLWALQGGEGLDDPTASELLDHPKADVRRWTVRWIGDRESVPDALAAKLIALADREPDIQTRAQLAATAKRLPAAVGLAIADRLVRRDLDADRQDPRVPLLLWWTIERFAVSDQALTLDRFAVPDVWRTSRLARAVILERLAKRYASERTKASFDACVRLLNSAPTDREREVCVSAIGEALRDRPAPPVEDAKALIGALSERKDGDSPDPRWVATLARLGDPQARRQAIAWAADRGTVPARRAEMLRLLGECRVDEGAVVALSILSADEPVPASGDEPVQLAALEILPRFDRAEIGAAVLRAYPRLAGRARVKAADALLSRKAWASPFLRAIDGGRIAASDVGLDQLRPLAAFEDRELNRLVRKLWGNVSGGTPEERLAEARRLNNDLRAGPGDSNAGRALFLKHCSSCHRLFGEGGQIGPDLTQANRKDRDYLLVSLVDPSAVVRREYLPYVIQTQDGRVATGLIVEQSSSRLVLLDGKGERAAIPADSVESLTESAVSLMPENLLKPLSPRELRNLFAYLQK